MYGDDYPENRTVDMLAIARAAVTGPGEAGRHALVAAVAIAEELRALRKLLERQGDNTASLIHQLMQQREEAKGPRVVRE